MTNLQETSQVYKDIPGYEGIYQISESGSIKSFHEKKSGGALKNRVHKSGYVLIQLCSKVGLKSFRVHRLVAFVYIPNPDNKPFVNHKDGNKQNNHKDNLEWTTKSENELHAYRTGLRAKVFAGTRGVRRAKRSQNGVKKYRHIHTLADIKIFFRRKLTQSLMVNPLKIDSAKSSPGHSFVMKPSPVGGFLLKSNDGVKMGSKKFITYKPPRIVKAKTKWYVEYYFRVPVKLLVHYKASPWQRFRVYEDINRHKTDEYAIILRDAVEIALENGYDPFEAQKQADIKASIASTEWSLNHGLEQYIIYCVNKGLRKKTIQTYDITVNFLKEYFQKDNRIYRPLSSFTRQDMAKMLSDLKDEKQWNANTYNNYLSLISSMFNWFVREEKIDKNPVKGIDTKKVSISMHKYYDDATAKKIKAAIYTVNPYLLSFCEFIYYTGTRPKSEARLLQVKHLLFDRQLIFIPGHISKNKKDDYIPMAPELEAMLGHLKGKDPELYIWGLRSADVKPASQNHFAALYKPFKDALGLDEAYTIYSWKHSRAIDLANSKVDPYAIMKLFRHSGLDITMKYLRDLGCSVDWSAYNIDKKF